MWRFSTNCFSCSTCINWTRCLRRIRWTSWILWLKCIRFILSLSCTKCIRLIRCASVQNLHIIIFLPALPTFRVCAHFLNLISISMQLYLYSSGLWGLHAFFKDPLLEMQLNALAHNWTFFIQPVVSCTQILFTICGRAKREDNCFLQGCIFLLI